MPAAQVRRVLLTFIKTADAASHCVPGLVPCTLSAHHASALCVAQALVGPSNTNQGSSGDDMHGSSILCAGHRAHRRMVHTCQCDMHNPAPHSVTASHTMSHPGPFVLLPHLLLPGHMTCTRRPCQSPPQACNQEPRRGAPSAMRWAGGAWTACRSITSSATLSASQGPVGDWWVSCCCTAMGKTVSGANALVYGQPSALVN